MDDAASLQRQLVLLGNQLMLIASRVPDLRLGDGPDEAERHVSLQHDSNFWLPLAECLFEERRRRAEFFPPGLFGEPAWDLLLELYISEKRNERLTISGACLGANAPVTTALRHLQHLERKGLVERHRDTRDGRRTFVRMTEIAYTQMTAYFTSTRVHWLADDILRPSSPERSGKPC